MKMCHLQRSAAALVLTVQTFFCLYSTTHAFAPLSSRHTHTPLLSAPASRTIKKTAFNGPLNFSLEARGASLQKSLIVTQMTDSASTTGDAASSQDESVATTAPSFVNRVTSWIPPASEREKLIPLGLMFFCILFNYTILRDTKDVLMVRKVYAPPNPPNPPSSVDG